MAIATEQLNKEEKQAANIVAIQGIKSLVIKNFRCFNKDGISINFDNIVTAFIGKNGCGKTTILEATHWLFGQEYLPSRISETDFYSKARGVKDEILIECRTRQPFFMTQDVQSNYRNVETILLPCEGVQLKIKRREKAEKTLDDPFVIKKMFCL